MAVAKYKIIVAIDFLEQSIIAMRQCYSLAKVYKAEIVLLHVLTKSEEKAKANDKLEKLEEEVLESTGCKVTILVAEGEIVEQIIHTGLSINAQLIFVGSNNKQREDGDKSISMRVVKTASCPVITVKSRNLTNICKTIVLPIDLTKQSKNKINKAIELAKLNKGSVIRVISALFFNDDFKLNRLTRELYDVKDEILQSGVECTAEIIKVVEGAEGFSDIIIEYAQKIEGDLIMIMINDELQAASEAISQEAMDIILNSNIPVLSINQI